MPDTDTFILPVLPLGSGVVLPQMVVTIALETPEARAAADAAVDGVVLLVPRLAKVLAGSKDTLAGLSLAARIRKDVADGMEKTQRDFLLRQQLAAIRKELGEDGSGDDILSTYRDKAAAEGVPEAVRDAILREVDRLERTSEQSPEHGW